MKITNAKKAVALIIAGCAIILIVWWQMDHSIKPTDQIAAEPVVSEAIPSAVLSSVELPPEKLKVAAVSFTNASEMSLGLQSKVPGRLQYDDRRHVEIRSATGGIITEIHVKPGDQVQTGDIVVEINSPEVGSARADVLLRKSELKIATQNRNWQISTCKGLEKLAEAIRGRVSVDNIRTQFKDVVLGKSRDQLLSAYSDLLLAESLATTAEQNAASGVVPGKLVEQRINARDNMESTLHSRNFLSQRSKAVNRQIQSLKTPKTVIESVCKRWPHCWGSRLQKSWNPSARRRLNPILACFRRPHCRSCS
jgi:multidrug efflux pump subunit AcrA (membrane-fusion protein)